MHREFSILKAKREAVQRWDFPFTWDVSSDSPLAGPFSTLEQLRLDVALGCFPFARRTRDGRRAWRVKGPGGSSLVAWVTSDGSLFVEGEVKLNLIYGLLLHLCDCQRDLLVEDRITGVVHDARSLARLVHREEAAGVPFELPGHDAAQM